MLTRWLRSRLGGSSSTPATPDRAGQDDQYAGSSAGGAGWSAIYLRARQAVSARPDDVAARVEVVRSLMAWGRQIEALAWAREAVRLSPESAVAGLELGRVLHACGRLEEAHITLSRVVGAEPSNGETTFENARVMFARVMLARADPAGALRTLEPLLARDPRNADARSVEAQSLARLERAADADASLSIAIAEKPDDPALHRQHAFVRVQLGDLQGADDAFRRSELAADLAGTTWNTWSGRAELARLQGDFRTASDLLIEGYRRIPDSATLFQLAEPLIARGWFRSGWACYEARRVERLPHRPRGLPNVPEWQGQPLDGRTVLVVSEQGVGDVCWFARYATLLRARGARVVLLPREDMVQTARRLTGVDHVLEDGEPFPRIDFRIGIMSLAHAFDTRIDDIPAPVPYLMADPARVAERRRELASPDGPLVGIVWAGRADQPRNRSRSIPLESLLPVLRVPGAKFVSLQKGPAEIELDRLPGDVPIVALGKEFRHLDDLVDAIAAMDLVISACTGPAHIAGALGKEVWTLLSFPPDLRWMQQGSRSPWYPTMRLFRQPLPGDWATVAGEAAVALREFVSGFKTVRPTRSFATDGNPPAVFEAEPEDPGIDLPVVVQTAAGVFMVQPSDDDASASVAYYGEHDRGGTDMLSAIARRDEAWLDVQCGAGFGTVVLARAIGPAGFVLALEPRYASRVRLACNLAANDVDNVSIVSDAEAASSIDGLQLDRLDGVVLRAGCPVDRILLGAEQTLWRCRPVVCFDGQTGDAAAERARALGAFGYRTFAREFAWCREDNFNGRTVDLFAGRRAVFVLAIPEERSSVRLPDGCEELRS